MKNLRNETEHTGVTKVKAGRLYGNYKGATVVEHFVEFNGRFIESEEAFESVKLVDAGMS